MTFPQRNEDIPGWGTSLDADLTLDYSAGEPIGYRHFQASRQAPRYPFGYGLGYSRFEVLEAAVTAADPRIGGPEEGVSGVAAHVMLSNSGDTPGRDVVQIYGRADGEPESRLMGFAAVHLEPGQQREVQIAVDPFGFRRWNTAASSWTVPHGDWELRVARHAADPGILCRIRL